MKKKSFKATQIEISRLDLRLLNQAWKLFLISSTDHFLRASHPLGFSWMHTFDSSSRKISFRFSTNEKSFFYSLFNKNPTSHNLQARNCWGKKTREKKIVTFWMLQDKEKYNEISFSFIFTFCDECRTTMKENLLPIIIRRQIRRENWVGECLLLYIFSWVNVKSKIGVRRRRRRWRVWEKMFCQYFPF